MPKQRITKEMVVEAAFEIARKEGAEKVIVKNIAERLGCSVQPIYSYCSNMEGLREELVERTRTFMKDYIASRLDRTIFCKGFGWHEAAQIRIPCRHATCPIFRLDVVEFGRVIIRTHINKGTIRTQPCRSAVCGQKIVAHIHLAEDIAGIIALGSRLLAHGYA